jgi:hypothetical protein
MSSLLEKNCGYLLIFFGLTIMKDSFTFKNLLSSGIVNWFLNYCQEIDKTQASRNFQFTFAIKVHVPFFQSCHF